jgi:hypothetical protein
MLKPYFSFLLKNRSQRGSQLYCTQPSPSVRFPWSRNRTKPCISILARKSFTFWFIVFLLCNFVCQFQQGILKGGVSLYCWPPVWFALVCFANKNKNCQLSYSWFQTSRTGGQRYSYTSPFSIPWFQTCGGSVPFSFEFPHWCYKLNDLAYFVTNSRGV